MLALMVAPLLAAVWLGFLRMTFSNVTEPVWVGLENYIVMLGDPGFWNSFAFSILCIAVKVPIQILLGLFVALCWIKSELSAASTRQRSCCPAS